MVSFSAGSSTMVAVKAAQAASFLKSIERRIVAILVFGQDAGLVMERAREAANRLASRESPPSEILQIEDADLENDPGRIAVEVQTVAMFGGARIVRTTASRRVNAQSLKPLLEPGAMTGALVVAAGNLKPDDALRKLFEASGNAAAIPCYSDSADDLAGVIKEMLAAAKISITPEARQLLASRLGADRALTRGEIDKLVIYAHGSKTIEVEDVEAIVGDAAELAIDSILLAASAGDSRKAASEFDRAVSSGESAQGIILMTQRHFQRLHRLRGAIDTGRSFEDAARSLRPPLHYKTKPILEAHCRAWTIERLDRALAAIGRSAKDARLSGHLEDTIGERMLLEVASMAGTRRR